MRIAVAYEDGKVFQHFGHTESFKVYEVEYDQVVSSQVYSSNGQGHGALAGFLSGEGVDVIICGGIGEGAKNALEEAGIELCAGATGDADAAVEAYLKGELVSTGVNCDHHHDHEEEEAGCGSNCGGGCSGCGGGCGGSVNPIQGKNVNKQVKVHYRGTFNDGTQFDSSYDRGEPLVFICGSGMMIKGFDQAVANMEVGEIVNVHLMPEEAYGVHNPAAIITVELAMLPGAEKLNPGEIVYLSNGMGQQFPAKVVSLDETTITFDANHEMAGKELNFQIELVDIL